MEGKKIKNRARALLVFGAPCSGKTTFAEKFSAKFGLAYYNFEELKKQNNFTRKQILVILEQIMKTKQTIVIEGEIDTEKDRAEMRNTLRAGGYDPALVWIQTDVATIRMRLKSRHKSVAKAKEIYDNAVAEIEAPSEAERPIILSGKHTFETQTKHAITGLADLIETK
ncbi:AAA family ATPase [Candidatus Saccharibacteria bacterium]|nr:AAA family ATPase [Candidatus Saccharibacteria bacterium]